MLPALRPAALLLMEYHGAKRPHGFVTHVAVLGIRMFTVCQNQRIGLLDLFH